MIESQNGTMTKKDEKKYIAKFKNMKSPGTDGFPGEYYKVIINDLTPALCKLYNNILKLGDQANQAFITILLREGKDPLPCINLVQ